MEVKYQVDIDVVGRVDKLYWMIAPAATMRGNYHHLYIPNQKRRKHGTIGHVYGFEPLDRRFPELRQEGIFLQADFENCSKRIYRDVKVDPIDVPDAEINKLIKLNMEWEQELFQRKNGEKCEPVAQGEHKKQALKLFDYIENHR